MYWSQREQSTKTVFQTKHTCYSVLSLHLFISNKIQLKIVEFVMKSVLESQVIYHKNSPTSMKEFVTVHKRAGNGNASSVYGLTFFKEGPDWFFLEICSFMVSEAFWTLGYRNLSYSTWPFCFHVTSNWVCLKRMVCNPSFQVY